MALSAVAMLLSVSLGLARPIRTDWELEFAVLKARVDSRMDEPRGYPTELEPYFLWLDIKATDRDEVLQAEREALDSMTGSPAWAARFEELAAQAQRSGESTVWDACYAFLRVNEQSSWRETLGLVRQIGRPLFLKAARTGFRPAFIRDGWVSCLIDSALGNLEAGPRGSGLYEGRATVFAVLGQDGLPLIRRRDATVTCGQRLTFRVERGDVPELPPEVGLAAVEELRLECDWWHFSRERDDATALMTAFFKDSLCFDTSAPQGGPPRSHQGFIALAERYQLAEAAAFARGFFGTVRGHAYLGTPQRRHPAAGAKVEIRDPRDGATWTTTADEAGQFGLEHAPLHFHQDPSWRRRCPRFELSAEFEGARGEETYDGPLGEPNPGAEFEKDVYIGPKHYAVTVELALSAAAGERDGGAPEGVGLRVVFEDALFGSWPVDRPLAACCDLEAHQGRGTLTSFEPNDAAAVPGERGRGLIKAAASPVTATLTVAKDGSGTRAARLVFRAQVRPLGAPDQSRRRPGEPADFRLEFRAPWRDLVSGKAVTLSVPYQGGPEGMGSWSITFAPKPL